MKNVVIALAVVIGTAFVSNAQGRVKDIPVKERLPVVHKHERAKLNNQLQKREHVGPKKPGAQKKHRVHSVAEVKAHQRHAHMRNQVKVRNGAHKKKAIK